MGLTLEGLAVELGKVVEPLESRLRDGEVEQFFRELGLPVPDVVVHASGALSAIRSLAADVAPLPPLIVDLVNAIGDEDLEEIKRLGQELIPVVKRIVEAAPALAQAIDAAAAAAGSQSAAVQAFAADLPERLFGYLVATYLEAEHPTAYATSVLFGLLEQTDVDATDAVVGHTRHALRLDRLAGLARDPIGLLAELHGWGTQLEWEALAPQIVTLLRSGPFSAELAHPLNTPSEIRTGILTIRESDGGGIETTLGLSLSSGLDLTLPLSAQSRLELELTQAVKAGSALVIEPPLVLRLEPGPDMLQFDAALRVEWITEASTGEEPLLLIGARGGPRLVAREVRASAKADFKWSVADGEAKSDVEAQILLEEGQLVVDLGGADGFLRSLLPQDGFVLDFGAGVGWSESTGLYFLGSASLQVDIPVDLDLGPLKIISMRLQLGLADEALQFAAGSSVMARLGPFGIAIDQVGARMELSFPPQGGNLGVADLSVGFKPPEGIGLSLDASVVKGGGFLGINEEGTEYAGILELSIGPVSIKAIGILTTEIPGAAGWALLLLVFTEFTAVQLGFGFTLNGVGGIIGLQHGIATTVLQSGLRTGVLDSVLFPPDPVANAPRLLNQLRAVFPITPRALTIGPVAKIGWSTPPLVTLSLGIVLQFDDVIAASDGEPQLTRVVLLGQLRIQVPPALEPDTPELLKLLVDIIGSYEVRERALAIDARLRDSHVAGLPLTGSLVVRARFGAEPSFILAVGGFHPRFTDLPPGIPAQQRVGFQLVYDIVTVQIVGYTAITSNTFQIGAEASLLAAGGGFRVEAYLGFDALFLFQPVFHFEIDFRVGASVKYKSVSLMSLKVKGVLSGPGHWLVTGHASFSVLFWDVDIDFEVEWGDAPSLPLPSIAVRPLLVAALQSPDNWQCQLPVGAEALVTLRQPTTNDVLAHPLGELSVLQRVVPLGVDIDRVGNSRPSDGNNFDIPTVEIGTPGSAGFRSMAPSYREEHFARGEYLDLSEEEKLSTPSFERFRAGVSLSSDVYVAGESQIRYDPELETLYLGQPEERDLGKITDLIFTKMARFGAASYSPLRAGAKLAADDSMVIHVTAPVFTVAGTSDLNELPGQDAASHTLAAQAAKKADSAAIAVEVAELVSAP